LIGKVSSEGRGKGIARVVQRDPSQSVRKVKRQSPKYPRQISQVPGV